MSVNRRPPVELENGVAPILLLWLDDIDAPNYTSGYTLTAELVQAGASIPFTATVTANANATADRDQVGDVPTFTVTATAPLAGAAVGPASVIVAASISGVCRARYHCPAKVIA